VRTPSSRSRKAANPGSERAGTGGSARLFRLGKDRSRAERHGDGDDHHEHQHV